VRLSPARRARRGFTLLEVLLASLIAVLLLGALYFAMDLTLRQTQDTREAVEVDNLSRGVFNRMTIDLSCSLAPLPPKSGGNANSATSTATGTESATASTTTGSTGTGTGTATETTTTTTETTTTTADGTTTDPTAAAAAADLQISGGLFGSERQLSLFVARTPDVGAFDPNTQGRADLRRITYWLGSGGGLCRQERPWVLAEGVRNSVDPDLTFGEEADTIASEVKDVLFEYFDGSGWASTWDGSTLGPDGVTPQGPPRAVRATLTMEIPASRAGVPPVTRTVVQVIPIRAAPGTYTPPLVDPYTEGTTTAEETGTSGTGTTGGTTTGGTGGTTTGGTGGTTSGGTTGGGR
jgi:prepilin-type N-terminal cleavage/methylation domain-containing protein